MGAFQAQGTARRSPAARGNVGPRMCRKACPREGLLGSCSVVFMQFFIYICNGFQIFTSILCALFLKPWNPLTALYHVSPHL